MRTRTDTAPEIEDIVLQLVNLQAQEFALLGRLRILTATGDIEDAAPGNPRIVTATGYERDEFPAGEPVFAIGDRVRIRNPRFLQPAEGVITKITRHRITVEAPNGSIISRAPKNITR
jgi:hypothetical protein